jgi:glycosyltransferase involved in cell wall biosynthesis
VSPARVLLVHNRYQRPGGEDVVFEAEAELLRCRGHEVEEWVEDNATIDRIPAARLAIDTVWSTASARRLEAIIARARPDVAHFHNTFPLISPSAYAACRAARVPVVQTLHNYRLICPNGLLLRDGHPCEDCVGRSLAWPGVVHACYRESRAQTAVVSGMLAAHRLRGTWSRDIDVFVALTRFAREKFIQGGLPESRIRVKPNFIPTDPATGGPPGQHFLYAGRLSGEKGIRTLLDAWARAGVTAQLRIAGSGPLEGMVREAAARTASIRYLGQLSREDLATQLRGALALVFPSEWYEGMPMTILEAFACGRPVLAARLGGMEEMVTEGITGSLFRPADPADLSARLAWASGHPAALAAMGANARSEYTSRYTPDANYPLLMDIYREATSRQISRA